VGSSGGLSHFEIKNFWLRHFRLQECRHLRLKAAGFYKSCCAKHSSLRINRFGILVARR
jgi:hypothetical protein